MKFRRGISRTIANNEILSRAVPIALVLVFGACLIAFLGDLTLQADPFDWMATARRLFLTGDTGFQFRNILFSYLLALPMFLGLDAVRFGVGLSGLSLILSVFLLYKINLRFVERSIATYTSLLFLVSYPLLRYGTQVFTDIPAVFGLMAAVFCHLRFLETQKPADLLWGYFALGFAVSLRYAAGLALPAFLFYAWRTRRAIKWHGLGLLAALVPYVPQLWFNARYLRNPIAFSYAANNPVFGLAFFSRELGNGIKFQLLHYLRYLFLDFRGLFAVLTPVCILGAVVARRRLNRSISTFLMLFFGGVVGFLAFYAFFSNRYAIPALIPCFVWTAIGFSWLSDRFRRQSRAQCSAYLAVLILLAYGLFEISFQTIQSSRAIHQVRQTTLRGLDDFVEDGDVVITLPSLRESVARLVDHDVKAVGASDLTTSFLTQYQGRSVYVVWTPKQWTSEGGSWKLSIDAVSDRLVRVRTVRSAPVIELGLYRLYRWLGLGKSIPSEEWVIFRFSLDGRSGKLIKNYPEKSQDLTG